ncbi:hypothetical protein BH23GEM8_BH23GEM8_11680 [soil metagenome]
MKLIHDFLPVYDAAERHAITVRVPAELVYRAIRSADLAGAPPVRLLLALRALPAALTGGEVGCGGSVRGSGKRSRWLNSSGRDSQCSPRIRRTSC